MTISEVHPTGTVPFDDPVDEGFVRWVEHFFAVTVPDVVARLRPDAGPTERARAYRYALDDAGLTGLTVPTWAGGRGRTPAHQEVVTTVGGRTHYELDKLYSVGINMVVPTLVAHGSDSLVEQHVPATLHGDLVWCQLYSEPGAGSDLASLATRAVRDGDEWVVSGQKVWTSHAQHAQRGIALVRTDTELPKHQGITMMVIDMTAPGVTVRPLHQMTGGSEFNEVFLDEVRVPVDWVVGAPGDGWRMAVELLAFERAAQGAGTGGRQPIPFPLVLDLAKEKGRTDDPIVRQELAALYTNQRIIQWLRNRADERKAAGLAPGPETSVAKLWRSRQGLRIAALAARLAFEGGCAWEEGSDGADWAFRVLDAPGLPISGGTDEVQRNTIGERVLGLPPEPSADKGVAFRDLRVGTQRPG